MLYVALMLGTSAVKLLMMDENGNIQENCIKEYPLYFPYPELVRTESTGLVCAVMENKRTDI